MNRALLVFSESIPWLSKIEHAVSSAFSCTSNLKSYSAVFCSISSCFLYYQIHLLLPGKLVQKNWLDHAVLFERVKHVCQTSTIRLPDLVWASRAVNSSVAFWLQQLLLMPLCFRQQLKWKDALTIVLLEEPHDAALWNFKPLHKIDLSNFMHSEVIECHIRPNT